MMNEALKMIIAFIVGLALGALFFGGLWLTVRKAVTTAKPAFLILGSFIIRIALVLIGFYFIGTDSWQRLLIALLGFLIARFLAIHFTKAKQPMVKKEVSHET